MMWSKDPPVVSRRGEHHAVGVVEERPLEAAFHLDRLGPQDGVAARVLLDEGDRARIGERHRLADLRAQRLAAGAGAAQVGAQVGVVDVVEALGAQGGAGVAREA